MRRRRAVWLTGLSVGAVVLAWTGLSRLSLRALDEPGRAEAYLATQTKRFMVGRAARGIVRVASADRAQSAMTGQMQFRARCASCHGQDGRTATEIGVAMHPRASDLSSAEVQRWSDAELFWIIQNGIRLTGMPGFGKSLSDEEIWPLVDYIRTLRASESASK